MKQTPVYLGRKKREDSDSKSTEVLSSNEELKEDQIQIVGQINVLVDSDFDYEDMF